MLVTDPNIHLLKWTPNNTSASINKVLADCMFAVNNQDCVTACISSNKAFGGALISIDRPVPFVNGALLPYLKASWKVSPSAVAVKLGRLYELDSIVVNPPPPNSATQVVNWYDGSSQINLAEGGMFQIDKVASIDPNGQVTYTWVDSGFKGGPLPPDAWTQVEQVYQFDWTGQKSSVLSLQQGTSAPYSVPTNLQGIPANKTNWAMYVNGKPQPFVHFQAQLCLDSIPGGFEVDYQLTAYWSDNANFQ